MPILVRIVHLLLYWGYPLKPGQLGVGQVPSEAEFGQEFRHLSEDRPTLWDCGPKAFSSAMQFVHTGSRASGALRSVPDFPKAVCIVTSRRSSAATATQRRRYRKQR